MRTQWFDDHPPTCTCVACNERWLGREEYRWWSWLRGGASRATDDPNSARQPRRVGWRAQVVIAVVILGGLALLIIAATVSRL